MRLGRVMQTVAVVLLLGVICADLVGPHCDLLPAMGSSLAVTGASSRGTDADPCRSGCVPDCYCCSQSEEAVVSLVELGPRVVALAFATPATRAIDGFRTLPYHPPLGLL